MELVSCTSGSTRRGASPCRWGGAEAPPMDSLRGSLPISRGQLSLTALAFPFRSGPARDEPLPLVTAMPP